MTRTFDSSRRAFLRTASALSAGTGVAAPFMLNLAAVGSAAAQSAVSDYKALVCIYMYGGNDQSNTLLATDSTSYNEYTRLRTGADGRTLALPLSNLLPITPATAQSGRTFAIHPKLGGVQRLFNAGRLAFVSNVGALIQPLSITDWRAGKSRPRGLFSHSQGNALFQALVAEGAVNGWGGRIGDMMVANNTEPGFTVMEVGGNGIWTGGRNVLPFKAGGANVDPITDSRLFSSATAKTQLRALITEGGSNLFEQDHAGTMKRLLNLQGTLAANMLPAGASTGAVANPPAYTKADGTPGGSQTASSLQQVARIIGANQTLGVKRQVFMISSGGWDMHNGLLNGHAEKMNELAFALEYFDGVLGTLGLRDKVTVFTGSDMGRTLTSNGDGTDHGWGTHHMVVGGAVRGGDIVGAYPTIGVNTNNDVGSGRLLAQYSFEQYGATLSRWFGLSETQLNDVFPNLRNFTTRDLGFLDLASV